MVARSTCPAVAGGPLVRGPVLHFLPRAALGVEVGALGLVHLRGPRLEGLVGAAELWLGPLALMQSNARGRGSQGGRLFGGSRVKKVCSRGDMDETPRVVLEAFPRSRSTYLVRALVADVVEPACGDNGSAQQVSGADLAGRMRVQGARDTVTPWVLSWDF